MPSVSPEQAKLMRAVAHGWRKPGGGGPPVSVAKEYVAADQGKATTGQQGKQVPPGKGGSRAGKDPEVQRAAAKKLRGGPGDVG